jgi:hypothetical protein
MNVRTQTSLKTFATLVFAATFACAGASHAAKCAGTNINYDVHLEETEIGKGNKLITWRGVSVTVADDKSAPYHLISGECVGSGLTGLDGKTRMVGWCARVDKDGDVLYEEWADADANSGNLKNIGGTGKFAKTANTARYQFSQLNGKSSAVPWVGDCK